MRKISGTGLTETSRRLVRKISLPPAMSVIVLAALIVGLLGSAASASASEPQFTTIPISFSFVDTDTCGTSVPITTTAVGKITITTFTNGTEIRHGSIAVTLSANGKTLTNNQHFNVIFSGSTRTVLGAVVTITVPGAGLLQLDAGRLVLDADGNVIFEAGPHQGFFGDVQSLCTYLADP